MFGFELYKTFRKKEVWIMLLICIALEIFLATKNDMILPKGVNKDVYNHYIEQVKGEYTEEKNEWLTGERDKAREYIENAQIYDDRYENGEIGVAEYKDLKNEVSRSRGVIDTLEYMVDKSMYLESIDERIDNAEYFYDLDVNDYIENMGPDIFVILLITVIVVNIFLEDYSCGTHSMIITSRDGRKKLFNARFLCVITASSLTGILFPVIELVVKVKKYNITGLNAGIRCLSSMADCNLDMSVGEYLGLCMLTRCMAAVIYGIIVMGITFVTQNVIANYVTSIGILYLPYILYDKMPDMPGNLMLCRGFGVYEGYKLSRSFMGIHGMIWTAVFYVIVCAGVYLFSRKSSD